MVTGVDEQRGEALPIQPMTREQMAEAVAAAKAANPEPVVEPDGLPVSMTKEVFEARAQAERAKGGTPALDAGRKVAVLGFTDSWKQAPFDDPSWEIWGLNELWMFIPRWTRWFEIHERKVYEADKKRTVDHIYALRAMTCPVYMHQHWDDIPMSVPYPLKQLSEIFVNPGAGGLPYFTNSVSYMIALAIAEGFNEIGIFGVDMAHDSEYSHQRPSCEYLIGFAQGRGIKVTIPPDCELLKTDFLYGYQQEPMERWNTRMLARENDMNAKLSQVDSEIARLSEMRGQYRGALQDTQHIRKNWKGLISL